MSRQSRILHALLQLKSFGSLAGLSRDGLVKIGRHDKGMVRDTGFEPVTSCV